jgi:hypothetical protein
MGETTSTRDQVTHAVDYQTASRLMKDNLATVLGKIEDAAGKSGRAAEDIRVVAVTKSVEVDIIRLALEHGLTEFGENRVQVLSRRAAMIQELHRRKRVLGAPLPPQPTWHMIGHLQRNKVKPTLEHSRVLHSIDSLRLAEEVSAAATALNVEIEIFLQVNLAGEKSKFGMAVGAVEFMIEQMRTLPGVSAVGLMTMAPFHDDPEKTRGVFARLKEIFEDLRTRDVVGPQFTQLSMGMSNDYAVAIEEGATCVRIGSALFAGLQAKS